MIEIIALILLCMQMGEMLRARGRKNPIWMQVGVVLVWIGSMFLGALFYGVYIYLKDGEVAAQNLGFEVYVVGFLSAIAGESILFLFARNLPNQPTQEEPLLDHVPKHSRLGIASFVLSIFSGMAILGLLIVAGIMEMSNPGSMGEESPGVMIMGLLFLAFLTLNIVSLGLGIAGFFRRDHKRVFSTSGTAIAGVVLVGAVLILVL